MRYVILKSSFDGISGGNSKYESIDEALREISYHKGWDSLKALHAAIRKWAKHSLPGAVFTTAASAIVVTAVNQSEREDDICHHCCFEGLDYEEIEPMGGDEGAHFEQKIACPECGKKWVDVFTLTDQRELT